MARSRLVRYLVMWLALAGAVGTVWLMGRGERLPAAASSVFVPEVPVQAESEPEASWQEGRSPAGGKLAGVWVPYLSLAAEEHTQEAFQEGFRRVADSAREKGLNALFVHVRPFCDALYPSELYPWSHILTGVQGQDPGFDPLAFMVEYTHGLGMEFHAWLNPLRVKTADNPPALGAQLEALREEMPYCFMEWEGALYLDPAYPYVRSLIARGAAEIVEKYPVDGIHFDDYFYPTQDPALDEEAYQLYRDSVSQPLDLPAWRTANISAMVAEVYERVKQADPEADFGISPQGNLENDRNMGADVAAWCAVPGYIDYICPQLYYSFENPVLPYAEALDQWQALDKREGLDLYIGLALYKAGAGEQGEDWAGGDVIGRQIEAAQAADCSGVVLYSAAYLDAGQTRTEMERAAQALARMGQE